MNEPHSGETVRESKVQHNDILSGSTNSLTASANTSSKQVNDLLDNLKMATTLDVKEKIEITRLQLERERIEIERTKTLTDRRFWVRNFGASITAIISLAAVLVSLSQVWVARIQKDKELAIVQAQREKELASATIQQERAWKLDTARFVLDHGDKLLGKDKAQRELMTKVMLTTFPPEYSAELIDKLEAVTDSREVKQELQNVRRTILPKIKETRDLERATANNDLNGKRGLSWWATELIQRGEYRPSESIFTKASHSCRCPQPFEGGIECSGWDDMAICEVVNGRCVTRCFVPR